MRRRKLMDLQMLKVVPAKSRMMGACSLFLQRAYWSLALLILFFIISHLSQLTVSAQMGVPKGGSPLYTGKYGAVVMNMIRLGGIATVIAMITLLLRRRATATGEQAGETANPEHGRR